MDQKKTGGFLKELRKERGLTQEQLAEIFGVSGRTVGCQNGCAGCFLQGLQPLWYTR